MGRPAGRRMPRAAVLSAALALAWALSPAAPADAAPRGARTAAPPAAPPPAAGLPAPTPGADGAPAPAPACDGEVREVRRDAVHVSTPAAGPLAAGATLASRQGARLQVTDAGSTWARAVLLEGPAPAPGECLRRTASPPAPAPDAAPVPRPSSARPGVLSRQAPPGFFEEAARQRAPRPRAPGPAAPSGPAPRALEVHGRLGAGVSGVADFSDRDAGWWRPFLESTVDLERPGAVAWTYRHRLRGQWRLDGRSPSQPWDGDEPRLGLHELRAGASFLDRRLTVGLGRLAPDGVAGAPTVDGLALEGRVATGLHLGAFGGLQPHPTSLLPDLRGAAFGAFLRGAGTAGAARLSGSLLLSGTTWKGALDETRVDARLAVSAGRVVDAWALARLDLWPAGTPGDRPVADLSRLLVGLRGRPARTLDLGARFAWHRWSASRRLRDLWGDAFASPGRGAVGLAGLDLRWEPLPGLELRAEGDADVSGPAPTGWAAGGALSWTARGTTPWRIEARYRHEDGDAVRGHHAGLEARLPFHPAVSLDLGYRFSHLESPAAGTSLEHDARLGLAARPHRSVLLSAFAEWMQGDDVSALFASGRLDWRF